jgi:hypothetical protein
MGITGKIVAPKKQIFIATNHVYPDGRVKNANEEKTTEARQMLLRAN